jgi:uncharacterized alkaline shock family protein YloU
MAGSGKPELPDTLFVRDIETRVFQMIVVQCLATIEGISLPDNSLFGTLLSKAQPDRIRCVNVDQDAKNHSVKIRVEVNMSYGTSIPEKSEEIHTRVSEEVTKLTGVHVASVHVVVKSVVPTPAASTVEE